MSTIGRSCLLVMLAFRAAIPSWSRPSIVPDNCQEGHQSSGALYLLCMPENRSWNGDLVIYAHGYVAFNEPIHIPDLTLPDGTSIPDLVNALGYAFATTSYSTNGLAVREGIEDVRDLIGLFTSAIGDPDMVYLVGASEGGLVATLAVEGFPSDFQGGLALCGPIGDFRRQVDYWGDFRVIWDVFFPGVIPGSAIDIPPQVIEQWDTLYEPEVSEAIAQKKAATAQLIHVTDASIDPKDPATVDDTVTGLLWYNVFATNDGVAKLGGQPFGNASRVYTGSRDDLRLNLAVERFQPDQAALDEIEAHYQTSGNLISPLVTMHTTGDPIIPYWHEVLYQAKVINGGSRALYAHIPIRRYGHCEFKTSEVLAAFALLVRKVTANELRDAEAVLTDGDARDAYLEMAREYGAID